MTCLDFSFHLQFSWLFWSPLSTSAVVQYLQDARGIEILMYAMYLFKRYGFLDCLEKWSHHSPIKNKNTFPQKYTSVMSYDAFCCHTIRLSLFNWPTFWAINTMTSCLVFGSFVSVSPYSLWPFHHCSASTRTLHLVKRDMCLFETANHHSHHFKHHAVSVKNTSYDLNSAKNMLEKFTIFLQKLIETLPLMSFYGY